MNSKIINIFSIFVLLCCVSGDLTASTSVGQVFVNADTSVKADRVGDTVKLVIQQDGVRWFLS